MERAQEAAERRGRPDFGEHVVKAAVAQHVHAIDGVGAHQHPGDQAADFQRRARGLRAGDADVAGCQAVQPGRIGEPHRRLHAGGGAEILVVEHQMCLLGRVPEIHLLSALSAWGD